MQITVEFIGNLNQGPYDRISVFEIKEDTSVASFLETLHFKKPQIKFIQVIVDGKIIHHSRVLCDGDLIKLTVPSGGG
ncbi:MAG: MoaD/ThiS family protein [Pseudomonadota bacterium]